MAIGDFISYRVELIVSIILIVVLGLIGLGLGISSSNLLEFFSFMMPLLLIILLIFIFIRIYLEFEKKIIVAVESRLPGKFINQKKVLEVEMVALVENAQEFIYATGGRSKEKEYLKAIEKKVKSGKIEYRRIILGNKITHELHLHLEKIIELQNVYIYRRPEEFFGFMSITDTEVILPLADPRPNRFETAFKTSDRNMADKYQKYILKLFADSKSKMVTSKEQIKKMCSKCKSNKIQKKR